MPGFLGAGSGGGGGTGGEIFFPKEFIDPVTKFRVSQPENLIDTDFEYGLQPTKWETVELINNTPSFFSKSGDTTIDGIISMVTNAGTREITVETALDHNLAVGIPINVTGTKSLTADGSFIIASIPNSTTFTYLCKANQAETISINDLYTSIITGEFFQGSQIGISDSEGIVTDGGSVSTLTVKTKSTHGFGTKTPLYLLNINSTISQDFQAANTATKSFDASNSATAQTFDGSNQLSSINIDWSNSGVESSITSTVSSVSTTENTITVTHSTENFSSLTLGTPLYYDVLSGSGFFNTNPRGVVFLKTTDGLGTSTSTFKVSELPDGDPISIESALSGTFQVSDLSRTFPGNNVDPETEIILDIVEGESRPFDGANIGNTDGNSSCTVTSYSGSLINVSTDAGLGLAYYTGAMLRYSTTGSAASGLANNATYFVDSFFSTGTDTYAFTVKSLPSDASPITVSGGTGTQTFQRIGVSSDKDIIHVRDGSFQPGDMVEYIFDAGTRFGASLPREEKQFYFIETSYDAHNYKLGVEPVSVPMEASGGTVTEFSDGLDTYVVHTFTQTGTSDFVISSFGNFIGNNEIEYLVVGGGGGGGNTMGGGGGAGGYLAGTTTLTATGTYPVVVGAGGAGASSRNVKGTSGGSSSFNGVVASGGGGGGSWATSSGRNGGSGGGTSGNGGTPGTGISGQGNNGKGTGHGGCGSYNRGGGGGGAGAAATNQNGGAGLANDITGTSLFYAGGGGGGANGCSSSGGSGVGGNGTSNGTRGGNGVDGRGGGGGAGGYSGDGPGGRGGHGTVIIKYRKNAPVTFPDAMQAFGGTTSDILDEGRAYRVHVYSTVGTSNFVVQSTGSFTGSNEVEYLVVGGGGGGGNTMGGGGGAGGYLTGTTTVSVGTTSVVVGGGGSGASSRNVRGGNGGNSSFGSSIIALGGGGGGSWESNPRGGNTGGSGGGGSGNSSTAGLGTAGQGNDGFRNHTPNCGSYNRGGGGGGAGAAATNINGGAGLANDITGTSLFYAGGGGAGANGCFGTGGSGVGGNGTPNGSTAGNGVDGRGGGGGAGGFAGDGRGGRGGHGTVIIRYPLEDV